MLASQPGRDLSAPVLKSLAETDPQDIEQDFLGLETRAREELLAEGAVASSLVNRRTLELRYLGQSATLNLPFQPDGNLEAAFHAAHEAASGHRLDRPVELVNLRLSVRGQAPLQQLAAQAATGDADAEAATFMPELQCEVPVHARAALAQGRVLAGPAIITDSSATTWLPPDWRGAVDAYGNLLLECEGK
jgi:N-methylhydantoinase A